MKVQRLAAHRGRASRGEHSACGPGSRAERLERRLVLSAAPIGSEFPVNAFTTGDQNAPALAVDGDGDLVVAWQSSAQGDPGGGVYAQRDNAAGQSLTPPAGVPTGQGNEFHVHTGDYQLQPAVAADTNGDFVIAWTGPVPGTFVNGIFAQRYSANGVPLGEFRVNTNGNGQQPAVAMDAAGDFVVAWSGGEAADLFGVFARRYDPSGRALGPDFLVNASTAGTQLTPSVGMDGRGGFAVAWTSVNQASAVFARRYDAAGAAQGGEFQVNGFTGTAQAPAVAVDLAGDFAVSWESYGQDAANSWGVYAKRYNATGQEQAPPAGVTPGAGNEFRVNATTADQQRTPKVAMDAGGDFVVAWATKGQDGSSPVSYGVYARQYTAAGSPITGEFKINTTLAGDQKAPALAMDLDGDFVAAWQGPDANATGVFAQRYDESTDSYGPLVGAVTGGGMPVTPNVTLGQNVPQFTVAFSGNLDTSGGSSGANSVTNPANWGLSYNGQDISSRIAAVTFALNGSTNRYEASLTVSPQLAFDGNYVLTAKQAIRDPAGNLLDGNFDGTPGGNFALPFTMRHTVRLGGELAVNSTTAGNQDYASVAVDAVGDFVVAWSSYGQDGSSPVSYGTYARLYNAAGVPQTGEFQVNTTTARHQYLPSVAMNSAGDFVVVWQSYGQDGNRYGVYARRFNAAGVPQTSELPVNTTTAGGQFVPSVAMDAVGDFAVAWESEGQDGSDSGVYARLYNAAGAPQTGELLVNTTTTGAQRLPSVAMDVAGDFVVAWQSLGQDSGVSYGIYARLFSAAGVPQTGELAVNTTTANDQDVPSASMDAAGDFAVAWQSLGQDGSGYGVYVRRYDAAGVPQTGEFAVNTTTVGQQRAPRVAMDAAGDFVVTWSSYGQDGSSPPSFGIYARRYNAAGAPLTVELPVNATTAGNQGLPSVAMDAGGDFVVAWASIGQDGSGYGVYAQRCGFNQPPTTLGIAAVNALENGAATAIDLTAAFADSTDPSSALSYSVVGDTNAALFSSTPIDVSGTLTLNYATGQSGQATLTIRAADTSGLWVDTSFAVTVRPNATAPTLSSITVNDGSAQRSQVKKLTLTFDRAVTLAAGAATLQLLNTGGSGANNSSPPTDTSDALAAPTTPDGGKTWVYTFAAASASVQKTNTGASTGSLIDGIYTISVDPTKVTANGAAMAAAASLTFHRLFGDVSGNGSVNTADYGLFRNAFGRSAGDTAYNPAFDFDGNGVVNTLDYGQFRGRFGKAFTYT